MGHYLRKACLRHPHLGNVAQSTLRSTLPLSLPVLTRSAVLRALLISVLVEGLVGRVPSNASRPPQRLSSSALRHRDWDTLCTRRMARGLSVPLYRPSSG